MSDFVDRALALWDGDVAASKDALDRFRAVYADPVRVNGEDVPVTAMVDRARAMGEAFADRRTVLHDVVEGDGFLAFAFDIHARHVGRWVGLSALVEPSGREVVLHGMDIIHLDATGCAAQIWAVNDQSDLLTGSGQSARARRGSQPQSSPR
jgi:SnoaL-like polyketide cyclase